jgi:hypothetical protein
MSERGKGRGDKLKKGWRDEERKEEGRERGGG